MKKLVSILLSVMMVIAVCAMSVSAFALEPVVSPSQKEITIITEVNGKPSKDVTAEQDKDNPRVYTFTYTGTGNFKRWEFPGSEEGKHYRVISKDGKSIKIEILDGWYGDFTVNAIVEGAPAKDDSKKSPKTGAVAALGVAAMGAGAAIIAAVKRREND